MNPNEGAFPYGLPTDTTLTGTSYGLTKREIFTMAAMQGILGDIDNLPEYPNPNEKNLHESVAKFALLVADATLAELAKEENRVP